jgi:hypothetical protein
MQLMSGITLILNDHPCTSNQINIFERKVYKRILGPIYDNEKENQRILTNKEIYEIVKKPAITDTIGLNR